MPIKRFHKFQVADQNMNRLQDHIGDSIDTLDTPWNNGRLVKSVSLTTTPTLVNHGLGANYQSWYVGRMSANATVWETASPDATKFIQLQASAPVRVDLYVL